MLHRQGGAQFVRVHGQSGMGKSALLDAFLNPIREQEETLILRGRCYQRESLAFRAFDQIFDGLSRHLTKVSPRFVDTIIPKVSAHSWLFLRTAKRSRIRKASRAAWCSNPQELRKQAFRSLRKLWRTYRAQAGRVVY